MPNYNIGVEFSGNLGNLSSQAAKAVQALGNVGAAAENAGTDLTQFGQLGEHAFDEVAAGAAAMARIEAAIGKMVGQALKGADALDKFASTTIQAITPLSTMEARLDQISDAIGKVGTVQGAARLATEFDILNRTLQETKTKIDAASASAIGLSRAFATVSTSSTSLNRLAPAIKPALDNLKLLPPAANAAAASLARIRPAAGQGSVALNDFSRIIQDFPFGLVGIGNNITQLTTSFGDLRKSTGSTGGALKALVSSAGGFGGIGLAISAITTAVTLASVGFGAWTRGIGGNKEKLAEAKKELEEFLKTIKTVPDIVNQATGSMQGQIAQVQGLAAVVLNTNNAYEKRKRALEELGQINKNYFGDLKLEAAQLSILAARVKEYSDAIVAQAVLKGFTDEISRVAPELGKQEQALSKAKSRLDIARSAYAQAEDAANKFRNATTASGGTLGGVSSQTDTYTRRLNAARGELNSSERAFKEQRDAVEQLGTNMALLKGQIQGAISATLGFRDLSTSSASANKKETDALRERIDALKQLRDTIGLDRQQQREIVQLEIQLIQRDGAKDGLKPKEIEDLVDNLISSTRFGRAPDGSLVVPVPIKIAPNIDVAGAVLPDGVIPDNAFDKVIKAAEEGADAQFKAMGERLRQGLIDNIANSLVNGIAEAGDLLGQAVAGIFQGNVGESIAAAANGFLGLIGNVLQEVGKQVIVASQLIAVLKKALSKIFGPGGEAISAGVGFALVALGGILKNIKIPAFADGVKNFQGGFAMVGERGPELAYLGAGTNILPNHLLGAGSQSNRMYAVLRGEDLYLSTNAVAARRSRV